MMSLSLQARIARIFGRSLASLFFLLAISHACASFAMTVDDLDPSEHFKVGAISFKGNQIFPDSALQGVMKTTPRPFYIPWKARPEFEPGTFSKDLTRLRIFYETHGYYHLRLAYNLTTQIKGKDKVVDAELNLVEGRPVKIEAIDVSIDGYHPPPTPAPM